MKTAMPNETGPPAMPDAGGGYARQHTSGESRDLGHVIRRSQGAAGNALGSSSQEAGAVPGSAQSGRLTEELLASLVHALGARSILDLGLESGASALAMAEAAPEGADVHACSPGAGDLGRVHEALEQARHGDRIILLSQDPMAALTAAHEPYDLVRLALGTGVGAVSDAVARQIVRTLLDRGLLSARGLLVVHDVLLPREIGEGDDPAEAGEHSSADFNDWLSGEQRLRQVMLPMGGGVTIARLAP